MEIGIQEVFKALLDNVKELTRLNAAMERVIDALDAVEKNENEIIIKNKGTSEQLESIETRIRDIGDRTDNHSRDLHDAIEKAANAPAEKVDSLAIVEAVNAAIDKSLSNHVDKKLIEDKERWTKRLIYAVIALIAVIFTLIGLDLAGVINLVKTAMG